jgi:hypothetical protein
MASLALIAGLCLLEANTPDQLSFGTLYFFPVAWATWAGGLPWGLAAAGAASAAWGIGNYAASPVYDHVPLRLWTMGNDLLTYGFMAWLVDRFRGVLTAQEAAMRELQKALDAVQTLEGLFPVCAWCRRVRDDQGYWSRIEDYLARQKGALVSHGICPECKERARAELTRPREVEGESRVH